MVATANMNTNDLYVQGSVGASKLSAKADGSKIKGADTALNIAVGKSVGNVRYAVDFGTLGKAEETERDSTPILGTTLDSVDVTELTGKTLGASAFL